jgi:hypothetical protein
MSHGTAETERLRANVEDQLNRLLTQLSDLEEMREELDDEEYASSRQETMEQLAEFNKTMEKMMAGNMSLVSELGGIQLAIQSAIRSAFKSPDVIRMFAKKETGSLRTKLRELDSSHKLGKLETDLYEELSLEVLIALEKLGEPLSAEETARLNGRKDMESVGEAGGGDVRGSKVVGDAMAETRKSNF